MRAPNSFQRNHWGWKSIYRGMASCHTYAMSKTGIIILDWREDSLPLSFTSSSQVRWDIEREMSHMKTSKRFLGLYWRLVLGTLPTGISLFSRHLTGRRVNQNTCERLFVFKTLEKRLMRLPLPLFYPVSLRRLDSFHVDWLSMLERVQPMRSHSP